MTEIEKSFKEIQNRRMVLSVVPELLGGGYGLNRPEKCVFYFGDGQFVLRPTIIKMGELEEECTAIHMGGGFDKVFVVLETIETINEFLFGVYSDA
jgi:hypothetical protein